MASPRDDVASKSLVSGEVQNLITEAMFVLERETCILTFNMEEEEITGATWVLEFKLNMGCAVEFKESQMNRTIWLSRYCLPPGKLKMGVIHHFVMLALGFKYEHTRPDRDSWVKIWMENVEPGNCNLTQ